ncbi:MAG: toll/interleukin-1 receptor domain-containing protein [Pseudomonadota bacterium]
MPSVFFSYSHADEALRDQLEKQLAILKRQGLIETWHDQRIDPGQEFGSEINIHVEKDDIILLLISSDFLASDYCYEKEMLRAIERHDREDAIVIPVILRDCLWHDTPFGKILGVPTDGKPVTQWPDRDRAFRDVAQAVQKAAKRLGGSPQSRASSEPTNQVSPLMTEPRIRSSNLRVSKSFTDRDRDAFLHEAFDYMAKYFENSLTELESRNPEIEGAFRRIDANRFTAVCYRGGKKVSACTIFTGSEHFGGLAY